MAKRNAFRPQMLPMLDGDEDEELLALQQALQADQQLQGARVPQPPPGPPKMWNQMQPSYTPRASMPSPQASGGGGLTADRLSGLTPLPKPNGDLSSLEEPGWMDALGNPALLLNKLDQAGKKLPVKSATKALDFLPNVFGGGPIPAAFGYRPITGTIEAATEALGKGQPTEAPPGQGAPAQGEKSLFERLDEERGFSVPKDKSGGNVLPIGVPSPNTVLGQVMSAVPEFMEKYGAQMKSEEDAAIALKAEFEDTPELDEAIQNAKMQLSQAQGQRKQPGFLDFIALALMNLSGMNPSVAAEAVLGTGRQEQRESQLQDYLNSLETGRASARMGGRRAYNKAFMDRQDMESQMALRQALEGSKQAQQAGMMDFRERKLSVDKLMQRRGQIAQEATYATDLNRKKKLIEELDAIDKLLNPAPQPQQAPQDKRQSRMFGGLASGDFA